MQSPLILRHVRLGGFKYKRNRNVDIVFISTDFSSESLFKKVKNLLVVIYNLEYGICIPTIFQHGKKRLAMNGQLIFFCSKI